MPAAICLARVSADVAALHDAKARQQAARCCSTQVGAVLFDEFHERNLDSDLSLALCLDAQRLGRPDLRLAVMSVGGLAPECALVSCMRVCP